jgi:antitoxin YefM
METIAISDLKSNLPNIVKKVSNSLKRFVITISGKPKAVIISLEELESLEETAQVLSTTKALEKIKKGSQQAKKSQGTSIDDYAWKK